MNKPGTTATATPVDRAGRGRPRHGRLVVAEHVGQTAAQAAQAVRRSGLRPGLERSLGCAPEVIGQVIAQEPSGGSELARNAMVTLYIGAPGAGPLDIGEDSRLEHPANPALPPLAAHQVAATSALADPQPTPRRRRKPGGARRSDLGFHTRLAPVLADSAQSLSEPDHATEIDQTTEIFGDTDVRPRGASGEVDVNAEIAEDERSEEPWHEGLLMCAENVFAGRTTVARSRAHPARRALRLRKVLGSATTFSGNPDERREGP
jgi:hypothetical protein